jgi:hypothetical protein
LKTQIVVLISAILLFIVVLNLVRLRRLREEYSWLWLAAATFYLVMALIPDLIEVISDFIGITNAITAFVFFGLLFIVLILIHYSVRLSKLTNQMKDVAQQIALLDGEQNKLNRLIEKNDGENAPTNMREEEESLPSVNVTEGLLR